MSSKFLQECSELVIPQRIARKNAAQIKKLHTELGDEVNLSEQIWDAQTPAQSELVPMLQHHVESGGAMTGKIRSIFEPQASEYDTPEFETQESETSTEAVTAKPSSAPKEVSVSEIFSRLKSAESPTVPAAEPVAATEPAPVASADAAKPAPAKRVSRSKKSASTDSISSKKAATVIQVTPEPLPKKKRGGGKTKLDRLQAAADAIISGEYGVEIVTEIGDCDDDETVDSADVDDTPVPTSAESLDEMAVTLADALESAILETTQNAKDGEVDPQAITNTTATATGTGAETEQAAELTEDAEADADTEETDTEETDTEVVNQTTATTAAKLAQPVVVQTEPAERQPLTEDADAVDVDNDVDLSALDDAELELQTLDDIPTDEDSELSEEADDAELAADSALEDEPAVVADGADSTQAAIAMVGPEDNEAAPNAETVALETAEPEETAEAPEAKDIAAAAVVAADMLSTGTTMQRKAKAKGKKLAADGANTQAAQETAAADSDVERAAHPPLRFSEGKQPQYLPQELFDIRNIRITGLTTGQIAELLANLTPEGLPKIMPQRIIIHHGAHLDSYSDLRQFEVEFCYEPEHEWFSKENDRRNEVRRHLRMQANGTEATVKQQSVDLEYQPDGELPDDFDGEA